MSGLFFELLNTIFFKVFQAASISNLITVLDSSVMIRPDQIDVHARGANKVFSQMRLAMR